MKKELLSLFSVAFVVAVMATGIFYGLLPEGEGGSGLLRRESLSSIRFWSRLLEHFNFSKALEARAEQAQVRWSAGALTALMLLCGAIAYAWLSGLGWVPGLVPAGGAELAAAEGAPAVSAEMSKVLEEWRLGKPLLVGAAVCILLAHFIMRKIVDIRP